MNVCRHCLRPGRIVAAGLDSRCYRHRRRHGCLPPLEPRAEQSERLELRLSPLLLEHVRAAAQREGCEVSTWVRRVLERAALASLAATRE